MPENICTYCIKQIHLAYDFSQLCISSDAKLRLQRNRMVLHNIQKEIIEEEQIIVCDKSTPVQEENVLVTTVSELNDDESSKLIYTVESPTTIDDSTAEINDDVDSVSETPVHVDNSAILNLSLNDCDKVEATEQTETNIVSNVNCKRARKLRPKRHSCLNCSESFYTEEKLKKHAILHDPNRAYRCGECNKCFTKKSHLNIHLRCHAKKEDRKFTCKECGEQFMYSYLLKQHSYKHTEQKPFPCSECPKGKTTIS